MRKKTIIIIAIIAVVIVAVAVGIGVVFYQNNKDKNTPEEVLQQYMSYIEDENYEAMYELLTQETKNKVTKEDFITRNKNIYEGIEACNIAIDGMTVEEVDKENKKLHYKMKMDTVAGSVELSNSVKMVKSEDKKYYMVWSSKLIFPQLGEDDKVRVSTLSSQRGQLLDRNGVVLAGQGNVYSAGLVPGKMSEKKEEDIAKVAELLEMPVENINKALQASYVKEDTFVPLKSFSKNNQALKDAILQIKGIKINEVKARVYPLGEKISHLVGYVQNVSAEDLEKNAGKGYSAKSVIGKSGLEKLYEDRLRGTDGCEIYLMDSKGNRKETIAKNDLKNGEDIKLTIDVKLQEKIYNQFKTDNSANVAINPKTGEVLALVSTPAYDSNDFVLGMSNTKWNTLKEDSNKPMYNRYQATWVPGSSFKPVIGAIGLTTGKMNADENYGRSGLSWQKDSSWGSYKVTTLVEYGDNVNLRNALINSDNIYFAKSAIKIGADTLAEQLQKIGFDKELSFEQGMSKSQFADKNKIASEVQLADTGYGQGKVLVNPLHMASIYSAFVNEGNMIQPYLEYKEDALPKYWIENAFTKEAAQIIRDDLVQVVEDAKGTAHSAKIQGVTIAGKTGTAEIKQSKEDSAGTELGWFNAFKVNEDKNHQLLLVSMVENVKERGGSHYLLPKVKEIFK